MSPITLPLATALVAGFVHALEADHMAAVTTFVSRRPHPLRALGFGVRWGMGHSLALLLAGGLLILLDLRLPEGLVHGLELGVGVMLIALGAGVLIELRGRRRPGGAPRPPHVHAADAGHSHGTTWVGAAHGLAGTAGFLAILPAAFLGSPWLAGGYLLCFGVGTVAAMGLYALLAGAVFHRVGAGLPGLGQALRLLTGAASMMIGGVWIHGVLA